ncbi:hypothetical protein MTR67_031884 [Solanum verrucosum]|uniref:Uncharacterized protein n=1 Tax=Solanum verrucosum TaxID=315347 RepID=A0AAF0U3G6_SOLVR|nr:hypothetical protein MTR67_031884 [Solanum verrucosum]
MSFSRKRAPIIEFEIWLELAVVADLQSRAGVQGRRCCCYSGGFVAGFIHGRIRVCLVVYGICGYVKLEGDLVVSCAGFWWCKGGRRRTVGLDGGGSSDSRRGMTWLSPYYTGLNCNTKSVTLENAGRERLEWEDLYKPKLAKIISSIRARKLVGQDCLAYLAHVWDIEVESPSVKSIPVISEF